MYNMYMRFEVPQFIEIEDKIFGPFTWKQFIYLGGGIGLAVVMLFTLPFIIFVLFGAPIAALAAALAFYPVNNRPFSVFLEGVWAFYKRSRLYYWRKKNPTIYKQDGEYIPPQDFSSMAPASRAGSSINSLSRKLELNALQKTEQ